MNEHPTAKALQDLAAAEAAEAVEQALGINGVEEPSTAMVRVVDRSRAERERQLDEAMADVVEVVRRQRQRLGRRVCSPNDGNVIRQICALLRGMSVEVTSDNDPSWGE